DRTVDQAGDQRLLLGRSAFALEIAARDAARRVGLFLVVAGERQEIDARLRVLGGHDGGEHRRFAVGRNDGAVGLTGYLAGLEDELAPRPVDLLTMNVEHSFSLSRFAASASRHLARSTSLRLVPIWLGCMASCPASAPNRYLSKSHEQDGERL